MRLDKLKSAIRTQSGNPLVTVYLPDGHPITVAVQKKSILEALDSHFDGQRGAETGLRLGDDGLLTGDSIRGDEAAVSRAAPVDELDLDDLDDTGPSALDLDEIDEL